MSHQKLPRVGPERELLREKGQFWTPTWVARAMVQYVIAGGSQTLFDPAVGEGAFFRAAKSVANEIGRDIALFGTEIDPEAIEQATQNRLSASDLAHIRIADFLLHPPDGPYTAIVCNPPYIRHHRLSAHIKADLKEFASKLIGRPLDGRAGLHVYFLLRALQLLEPDGRLAFIMPADTCEGVFAPTLWAWITREYRLDAVVTFTSAASPFPGVDTNAVVFMIRNAKPNEHFLWARCAEAETTRFEQWVASGFEGSSCDALTFSKRQISEGVRTGLSRATVEERHTGARLSDYATVTRGIATGANDFFFLTVAEARERGIPDNFLVTAIGRTRDVVGDEITAKTIADLDTVGRPTQLFSPDGRPLDAFPASVRNYLDEGEQMGLDKRPLIMTRRPWYKMETRVPPPILFAYLGRRNARFVRNRAGVVPLTGFLCVYPRQKDATFVERLWAILQNPEVIANLSLVGKSYGSGAIKVEPRALEHLPLPAQAMAEVGLTVPQKFEQMDLLAMPTL